MMRSALFTSESVTEGHPDKVCDQIADQILDELLAADPMTRCACEVIAEPGRVHIMGEITSGASVDYEACARKVIRRVGYTDPDLGFTDRCAVTSFLHRQSPDIALGVDRSWESKSEGPAEIGAGDQGIMFGYACDETANYMPLAIQLAHGLTRKLAQARKSGALPYLRPDGKSQVTVQYQNGLPQRVEAIVLSTQHDPDVSLEQLRADLEKQVIRAVVPDAFMDADTKLYINPTGRFVLGGPAADTGLTGRKIIADTYGGYARHGGGSFSGKDPTKVDRSAAYMARCIAKHIVASGAARQCEIQLGYAIGVARPVSIFVDTQGTGLISNEALADWIAANFDLRPSAIIDFLGLRRPIYSPTSVYGHFGRDEFPWERLDAALLRSLAAQ